MRRTKGEGSTYRRKDGQWCGSLSLSDGSGRRRRRVVYGKTRKEVSEKLFELRKQAEGGMLPQSGRMTVAQYLERWLEDGARPQVRPKTLESYRSIVRCHLVPNLGRERLSVLSSMHVQQAYAAMEKAQTGARTRQLAHAVLHRALSQAVRWDLIPRNPAAAVVRPRVDRREVRALSASEVREFLRCVRRDPFEALYVLAVTTGLRQGELFGLRWKDIDLRARKLSVQRAISEVNGRVEVSQPKTAKGRRRVELPGLAVEALREQRKRSRATPHPEALVFPDSRGGPLRKYNFNRRSWQPLRERAGLRDLRFHDLRHSAATLLLSAGVHPKVVQERLGHATISVTLDTYSHVLGSLQREAADRLDDVLGG